MRFLLPQIGHDHAGFEEMARLHAQTEKCFFDNIEIDMNGTHRFDADMCAPFGAILYSLGVNLNRVNLNYIPKSVETILSKNGFLSHYGRAKIPDRWGTTIPYQRFDAEDDHSMAAHYDFPNAILD